MGRMMKIADVDVNILSTTFPGLRLEGSCIEGKLAFDAYYDNINKNFPLLRSQLHGKKMIVDTLHCMCNSGMRDKNCHKKAFLGFKSFKEDVILYNIPLKRLKLS